MLECWGENDGSRKQPQAIMRDIYNIKYQVYHARSHDYAAAMPKRLSDAGSITIESIKSNSFSDSESRASSLFTENTILPWDDADDSIAGKNSLT